MTQSTDFSRGSCFFRSLLRAVLRFRVFLQALQLTSDHAGVSCRLQCIELRRYPTQPGTLQLGLAGEQALSFFACAVEILRMEIRALHSLALKVTSSPLRHLAALAVTALRVLVRPSCSCSLAANTVTTLWPSLNRIACPSAVLTKA